jgi:hypothetical protein
MERNAVKLETITQKKHREIKCLFLGDAISEECIGKYLFKSLQNVVLKFIAIIIARQALTS